MSHLALVRPAPAPLTVRGVPVDPEHPEDTEPTALGGMLQAFGAAIDRIGLVLGHVHDGRLRRAAGEQGNARWWLVQAADWAELIGGRGCVDEDGAQ